MCIRDRVDTVQNIMKHISKIAGVEYGRDQKTDVSLRVITDHIRSTTFMVGDGILPENEGRGYVLRRLLRRAARHGKLLGIDHPFLHEVARTVLKENENAYPELREHAEYITKVIAAEEERFMKTLDQGMDLLFEMIDKIDSGMEDPKARILSGEEAFKLYDTFGFPIDLTRESIQEKGIEIDEEQFERLMQQQRERARRARESMEGSAWSGDLLADLSFPQEFTGYEDVYKRQDLWRAAACLDRLDRGDARADHPGQRVFQGPVSYTHLGRARDQHREKDHRGSERRHRREFTGLAAGRDAGQR